MSDTRNPLVVSEVVRYGWEKALAHWQPLAILALASGMLSAIQQGLHRQGGMASVLGVAVQLLEAAASLLLVRAALTIHEGGAPDLRRWRQQLERYLPWLLTCVLFGLATAGGLLLLVVPGVLWGLSFCLAPILAADQALDPLTALHESRRLTQGHRGELALLFLASLGINLLGALALGVGLLVTVPTTTLAWVHACRRLQAQAAESGPTVHLPPHVPAGQGA